MGSFTTCGSPSRLAYYPLHNIGVYEFDAFLLTFLYTFLLIFLFTFLLVYLQLPTGPASHSATLSSVQQ